MDVQFNSDNRIKGSADLGAHVEARLRERLARFTSRLTRIEVHLRDVDGINETSRGIEARIETRPAGRQPLSVSDSGRKVEDAFTGALGKLVARLDREFGKLDRVR